jgi:hypothetical protein
MEENIILNKRNKLKLAGAGILGVGLLATMSPAVQAKEYLFKDTAVEAFEIDKDGNKSYVTLDMSNSKILSLATPTNDYDASTKKYVDDSISAIPPITTQEFIMTATNYILPNASTVMGKIYNITASIAATIEISSDFILGGIVYIENQYDTASMYSDGSQWRIV